MTEQKRGPGRPKVNSLGDKELNKAEEKFKEFDENIQEMTLDRMNAAPKLEQEPQTKIAQKDLDKCKDIYLKPIRTVGSRESFNEKYREDYNFKKEYVYFTAENKEIIGDALDFWTKPFAGMPAEEWKVPVNTPLWAPRYVAEQIKGCKYHILKMSQTQSTGADGMGQYYGSMAVQNTVQRLDAIPMEKRRSVFMGSNAF